MTTTTTTTIRIIVLFAITIHRTKSYFTVYRLTPKTLEQIDFLQGLYINNTKYDFWKEPSIIGQQVHLMINKSDNDQFLLTAAKLNVPVTVMIDNVEKKILEQKAASIRSRRSNQAFDLATYHSFSSIITFLHSIATDYPSIAQLMWIGTTHEGREIPLMKISASPSGSAKVAIWIDAGIHAREWIAPSTALYAINNLVTKYGKVETITKLIDAMDWYIAPMLNPDGYEYSRSSSNADVRMWRKNRSPQQCVQMIFGKLKCCRGVDLNRNFDWHFGEAGSSTDPCSEIYQGTHAFSEPETAAVWNFIAQHGQQIKAFITLHSYSQILIFPFGNKIQSYPNDVYELRNLALQAANALYSVHGTIYTTGTGADVLYPASGGSEDWAKGKMDIKYSYLFELRPNEDVHNGFLLPEDQIIPTARETFQAFMLIATQTTNQFSLSSRINAQCMDLDVNCNYWANSGACDLWISMHRICPLSCGICRRSR